MEKDLILDLIRNRWSPYAFSDRPVEDFKLKAILEAARYAPSCNNEQPWMFVFTTRDEPQIFSEFLGFLNESNRLWAKNVYALIISLARTNFRYTGRPNRHAFHDTGMAVGNMLIQATSMGVYIHQMAGFSVEKVRQYFKPEEGVEPVAAIALGYLGDGTDLIYELRKRDEKRRPRKETGEFIFKNSLFNPAF
jgi:nitroreductase